MNFRTCPRCGNTFFTDDHRNTTPAEKWGEIFIDANDSLRESRLCPRCLEELGMMNIMGFGE